MLYRTVLGMVLQAGQQLTGANFFFYYSTTIFKSTGLSNSYVTSIILGTVNVVATIFGLWLVKVCGRRKALIGGALWMFACFMVYTFVGTYALDENRQAAGSVLIVCTCLFIVAFATTWGPLVWAIVGELYPAATVRLAWPSPLPLTGSSTSSYHSSPLSSPEKSTTGTDWCLEEAVSFWPLSSTFFLIESKDRSLEEINAMYLAGVNPITLSVMGSQRVRARRYQRNLSR